VRAFLAGLPPAARWVTLGLAAFLALVVLGSAGWTLYQHREAGARRAFAQAAAVYRQAMTSGEEARLADAAAALGQFLKERPRSTEAAQAAYFLGNVEYRRGRHDAALAAFTEAAGRDSRSIGGLSRLGIGYAWEAKKEPARALAAYQETLQGRGPKDFLFAELLLATARAQEELNQGAEAVATYQRLLRDAPESPRADQARTRLAILGAKAA
jgi:tetratricopeptide (TPR) repeat protein